MRWICERDPEESLYAILGLHKYCSADAIHEAFVRLARAMHPDTGSDPVEFRRVEEAYHVLHDAEARAVYDADGLIRGREGRMENAALGVLRQAFILAVSEADVRHEDIVEGIRQVLKKERAKLAAEVTDLKGQIRRKRDARIEVEKRWSGTRRLKEFSLGAIDMAILEHEGKIQAANLNHRAFTIALTMLEQARYQADPQDASTGGQITIADVIQQFNSLRTYR